MPLSTRTIVSSMVALCAVLGGSIASARTLHADRATDPVVIDVRRYTVQGGRFSRFAEFQSRLQAMLDDCGKPEPELFEKGRPPNGRIGPPTGEAIQRLLACPVAEAIPADSPARDGVVTEHLWRLVMNGAPLPTVDERAHALVLSFEATDYADRPEWNLCQNGTTKGPHGELICYNYSDPCSYLTWGPRGATAGSGREIQYILWKTNKQNPELLKQLFGPEYAVLDRFFRLKAGDKGRCDGAIPLKIFMCAVWMDEPRRRIWEQALSKLGEEAGVRRSYEALYEAYEFDGGKLREFYDLWAELGLQPSEVDYAFFLDRATHQGGPPDTEKATVAKLARCMKGQSGSLSTHGSARRCFAKLQPHATQPANRLGRDVAFYLDAYREGALDQREINTWARYLPISAVHNLGLRDDVPYPLGLSQSLSALGIDLPAGTSTDVTPEEVAACPASVLTPLRRDP